MGEVAKLNSLPIRNPFPKKSFNRGIAVWFSIKVFKVARHSVYARMHMIKENISTMLKLLLVGSRSVFIRK
jgi:hypothetical protein